MPDQLLSLRLVRAAVMGANGAGEGLQDRPLALAGGLICADAALPEVDLSGYRLLPGIVDLHGDGFERQLFPRPSARFPLRAALAATEREAAAHGVTTAHLALSWSWEGGLRAPDQAELVMEEIDRMPCGIDLRVQLRAETHMVDEVPRLIAAVERHRVGLVIWNDHLEEGLQMRRRDPGRFALWAAKSGLTGQELSSRIDAARKRAREVPRALSELAEAFDRLGVHYGSHDDPDAETREYYRVLGGRIAEFPTSRRAAAAARAAGDPVLMGAPNVVRGGSQAGNIAAETLIREGLCDALVSDYHLPALAMAAEALVARGIRDLPAAWAMISETPAKIAGLADRGRLAEGLRADLVAVHAESGAIDMVIAGGRMLHLSGEAAHRFTQAARPMRLAAE